MTRSAQPSLYDEDFFTWTQDQAAALRRLSAHGDIDVEHLAEEVEDLGKRDLREVKRFLRLLLTHLMKLTAEPQAPSVPHWRSEARSFSRAAAEAYTHGMRQLIDVSKIWNDAAASLRPDADDLGTRGPTARPCPFALDDLFPIAFDVDDALKTMTSHGDV